MHGRNSCCVVLSSARNAITGERTRDPEGVMVALAHQLDGSHRVTPASWVQLLHGVVGKILTTAWTACCLAARCFCRFADRAVSISSDSWCFETCPQPLLRRIQDSEPPLDLLAARADSRSSCGGIHRHWTRSLALIHKRYTRADACFTLDAPHSGESMPLRRSAS